MTSNNKLYNMPAFLLACCLFIASIFYLFKYFDWKSAFTRILHADIALLFSATFLIQIIYLLIRTWRWKIIVRKTNQDIKFIDLYFISAITVSLSIVTPGQLGEALKIELLKRQGLLDRLPGLGAYVTERILDVIVVSGMAVIGLLFGSGLSARYPGLINFTIILFIIGILALIILLRFDFRNKFTNIITKIRADRLPVIDILKMGLLTVSSWFFVGIGWQMALHTVGILISFPEILWLISLVTLGTILSLIPGGFGVAEILTIKSLVDMGINPNEAQAGALILRAYGLIIICVGITHLLSWGLYLLYKRNKQSG